MHEGVRGHHGELTGMRRPGICTSALVLAGVLAPASIAPATAIVADDPVVYAHRGGAGGDRTAENTLEVFGATHETYGDDGVWLEMDTQLTGDGTLIVLHDDALNAEVNSNDDGWSGECARAVIDMTYEDVRACDPDVPTLAEVVGAAKTFGWRLMIEIKNIPAEANFDPAGTKVASALIDLLEAESFDGRDRLIVQSFYPPSLDVAVAQAQERGIELQSMLLTTGALPIPGDGIPDVGFPAMSNAAFSFARGYDIVAPDIRSADLSADTVAAIRAMGKKVIVWTANEEADIELLAAWGVDGIITDHPDLAYTVLAPG